MRECLICLKRNTLQDVKEKELSTYWKQLKNVKDVFKNIERLTRDEKILRPSSVNKLTVELTIFGKRTSIDHTIYDGCKGHEPSYILLARTSGSSLNLCKLDGLKDGHSHRVLWVRKRLTTFNPLAHDMNGHIFESI